MTAPDFGSSLTSGFTSNPGLAPDSQTFQPSCGLPNMTSGLSEDGLNALATAYRRICVVGLGYVGLPTALLFSLNDFSVQGVDVSEKALGVIRESRVGKAYPELGDWWAQVTERCEFRADARPEPADVFLITVPTPVHDADKTCDLSMVRAAAKSILPVLRENNLVILESTVPPGTTRNLLKPMIEQETGLVVGRDIFLCFSPERVLPGNITQELVHNHRIIGGTTPESALLGKTLLARVMKGAIYATDDISAEFCKLAENTYRDVNIALANELSILADQYGIDMLQARELINMHPRVNLLKPGIGVGGHCIAVDPWFFVEQSPDITQLIGTSRRVNDRMPAYTVEKILRDVADIQSPRIVLAGLTYKPDVADTRESPAMRVVEILRERDADVVIYDPLLPEFASLSLAESARNADYIAVLVPHSTLTEQLSTHRQSIESAMRTPRIRVF